VDATALEERSLGKGAVARSEPGKSFDKGPTVESRACVRSGWALGLRHGAACKTSGAQGCVWAFFITLNIGIDVRVGQAQASHTRWKIRDQLIVTYATLTELDAKFPFLVTPQTASYGCCVVWFLVLASDEEQGLIISPWLARSQYAVCAYDYYHILSQACSA
jgi:hypothetical protein